MRFSDLGDGDEELRVAITIIEKTGALDWIKSDILEPGTPVLAAEFGSMIAAVTGNTYLPDDSETINRVEAAEIIYSELQKRFGL